MDKNEVGKLVNAGTQALCTIHPGLESGHVPLNESLFLELREAVWQGVVLAAIRADPKTDLTVRNSIRQDMPERLVRIVLAEKALDTPAARAEHLAGFQAVSRPDVLTQVLTTISDPKKHDIDISRALGSAIKDFRIMAEIDQKISAVIAKASNKTAFQKELKEFNTYIEGLAEKHLQVAARNMLASRLQPKIPSILTIPSTHMGFDPTHVPKQKALFDAVQAAAALAKTSEVVHPNCLKLNASTLLRIANDKTILEEFQANVQQALCGLSETRQQDLIKELVEHYRSEITDPKIQQQILNCIDNIVKQLATQIDRDFVNTYRSMNLNEVCTQLRSGEIEKSLKTVSDLTQREVLVIISHKLSDSETKDPDVYDLFTNIVLESSWAKNSGMLSKRSGHNVNIVVALAKSGMWKRDSEGIASAQARASHMALWAGMGEQFVLGRRVTLGVPIIADGTFYEQASGMVAPMIQNMQTMGDVEESKGAKELDKIDVREVQQAIIGQAMLGATDLHLDNVGLVPIVQDREGNTVRYGVRFFDDDRTFDVTNDIIFFKDNPVAAVRICLLGTQAAGTPLSQEIKDQILRWDPKRFKEEFLKQPGPESEEDKKAAADALERRLHQLQMHLKSEPAATARSAVFAMYPQAEFSWLAGLQLTNNNEFKAGICVGNYEVPLQVLIRKLYEKNLLTQEIVFKLFNDLRSQTPGNPELWQEATTTLRSIKETL